MRICSSAATRPTMPPTVGARGARSWDAAKDSTALSRSGSGPVPATNAGPTPTAASTAPPQQPPAPPDHPPPAPPPPPSRGAVGGGDAARALLLPPCVPAASQARPAASPPPLRTSCSATAPEAALRAAVAAWWPQSASPLRARRTSPSRSMPSARPPASTASTCGCVSGCPLSRTPHRSLLCRANRSVRLAARESESVPGVAPAE
mmetsp:Transcript_4132/g.13232  ORF Transcript_4132/g.13232 Transcript_4132/m.13232 type:complete len:206 (-) Transcript_4132:280-897(-)